MRVRRAGEGLVDIVAAWAGAARKRSTLGAELSYGYTATTKRHRMDATVFMRRRGRRDSQLLPNPSPAPHLSPLSTARIRCESCGTNASSERPWSSDGVANGRRVAAVRVLLYHGYLEYGSVAS